MLPPGVAVCGEQLQCGHANSAIRSSPPWRVDVSEGFKYACNNHSLPVFSISLISGKTQTSPIAYHSSRARRHRIDGWKLSSILVAHFGPYDFLESKYDKDLLSEK